MIAPRSLFVRNFDRSRHKPMIAMSAGVFHVRIRKRLFARRISDRQAAAFSTTALTKLA